MNSLVSIVVVTRGKNTYCEDCLSSLLSQTYLKRDVILIDNSFDSELPNRVRRIDPLVRIFSSTKNLYYCASMNKGIDMSRGDFVLCLNDDVVLAPDFISQAVKSFAQDERIGMVSGKILRLDRETIDSTGLFLTASRTARERGYGQPDQRQFEKEEFIFGVSGAAAFYRKKMLSDIGLFDPSFRIFYEDMDLSWRAQRRGWKCFYAPKAVAYHARGGSVRAGGKQGKDFARQYLSDDLHADLIKNRYLMMIKNETWRGLLFHMPAILWYELCAWIYILFFKAGIVPRILSQKSVFREAWAKRQ